MVNPFGLHADLIFDEINRGHTVTGSLNFVTLRIQYAIRKVLLWLDQRLDALTSFLSSHKILTEDLEQCGISVTEPDDLADRTVQEIHTFFDHLSQQKSQPKPTFEPPSEDLFRKWFPGLPISKTQCENPRVRVLCFANAGNAEDMYTSEGTGSRRTSSPLLVWCRDNQAECLAVQLAGRNLRKNETPFGSCQEVAKSLFPVVASRLSDVPYFIVAHSVGTWCAFEFLQLARTYGLSMPQKVFFSAMASPNIAPSVRPWKPQKELSDDQFQVATLSGAKIKNRGQNLASPFCSRQILQAECRDWDVNEIIFSPAMWPTYQPLMRADFSLFDQYEFNHEDSQAFDFPITAFYGTRDKKILKHMVQGWDCFTSGGFELIEVDGHHLWPLQPHSKTVWLQKIVERLPNRL